MNPTREGVRGSGQEGVGGTEREEASAAWGEGEGPASGVDRRLKPAASAGSVEGVSGLGSFMLSSGLACLG